MSLPGSNLKLTDILTEYGYDIREFNDVGNGTVPVPSGTIAIVAECWGGGGGGGGDSIEDVNIGRNGAGGGGGGYSAAVFTGSLPSQVSYSVGAGGNPGDTANIGQPASVAEGQPGTPSSLTVGGSTLIAEPGQPGSTFSGGQGAPVGSGPSGSILKPGNFGNPSTETEPGPSPQVGGTGGRSITSAVPYYSGSIEYGYSFGNTSSEPNTPLFRGHGGGGGARFSENATAGANGQVRFTFVGNFGANNLTAYARSTSPSIESDTGQVVPDRPSNSDVREQGSISPSTPITILQFTGGQGEWRNIGEPPPGNSSILFEWDNNVWSLQRRTGPDTYSSLGSGLDQIPNQQTTFTGSLNQELECRLVPRGAPGPTPSFGAGGVGVFGGCKRSISFTQSGSNWLFDVTTPSSNGATCGVKINTVAPGTTKNWEVNVFAGNWSVPVTSGTAGVGDPVSISATFNSPPPANPIVTVVRNDNSQLVSSTYSEINNVVSFTMPGSDVTVRLESDQIF